MHRQLVKILASALLLTWCGLAWSAEPTGAAFCVTCHDSEDLPDMSRSTHGFKADKRAPDCTNCHGASETHAHKPKGVSKRPSPDVTFGKSANNALSAAARSQACLSCHDKDPDRALWSGSQHVMADVACDSCHKVHSNHDKMVDKSTQADACYTCHKSQRTQMNRPSHHPVPEGKMTCSSCHNVHGSAGPKLAKRDSTNATCYSCHAEKRGPMLHQHEPVVDDCVSCHNPHGSNVAGMLSSRPPMLCKQCHTPHVEGGLGVIGGQGVNVLTPTTRGQNPITVWQGRSCMNCHTQIHGSNNPASQFLLH